MQFIVFIFLLNTLIGGILPKEAGLVTGHNYMIRGDRISLTGAVPKSRMMRFIVEIGRTFLHSPVFQIKIE